MADHREEIEMLHEVMEETERFIEKCKASMSRFKRDTYGYYTTKEFAEAKRASMDLSRMLTKMRKPRGEW